MSKDSSEGAEESDVWDKLVDTYDAIERHREMLVSFPEESESLNLELISLHRRRHKLERQWRAEMDRSTPMMED